jgi:hypothetical protein
LLEKAINRDGSSETVASLLPFLRQIAQATGDLDDATVLARALRIAGQIQEVEEMFWPLMNRCTDQGKFRVGY